MSLPSDPLSASSLAASPDLWCQAKDLMIQTGSLAGKVITPVWNFLSIVVEKIKEIAIPLFQKCFDYALSHPEHVKIAVGAFIAGVVIYKLYNACCGSTPEDEVVKGAKKEVPNAPKSNEDKFIDSLDRLTKTNAQLASENAVLKAQVAAYEKLVPKSPQAAPV